MAYADSREGRSGHGTHVAGTVGGKREDEDGIVDGVAPRSKIAFFDIEVTGRPSLSAPNNPSTYFNEGRAASAKIHSASWGRGFNGYGFSERAFDNYMAFYDDFLVVIAAGNAGESGPGTVGSPATCKNGLSGKFVLMLCFGNILNKVSIAWLQLERLRTLVLISHNQ